MRHRRETASALHLKGQAVAKQAKKSQVVMVLKSAPLLMLETQGGLHLCGWPCC